MFFPGSLSTIMERSPPLPPKPPSNGWPGWLFTFPGPPPSPAQVPVGLGESVASRPQSSLLPTCLFPALDSELPLARPSPGCPGQVSTGHPGVGPVWRLLWRRGHFPPLTGPGFDWARPAPGRFGGWVLEAWLACLPSHRPRQPWTWEPHGPAESDTESPRRLGSPTVPCALLPAPFLSLSPRPSPPRPAVNVPICVFCGPEFTFLGRISVPWLLPLWMHQGPQVS